MKKTKKTKKLFLLMLALLVITASALAFTACGDDENSAAEEVGADIDTKAALESLYEKAKELAGEDVFFPPTLPLDAPVSTDDCHAHLGLDPADFEQYVTESYAMTAAIMVHAFDLSLIKCNDYASARKVKELVAAGFDPAQRICAVSEVAFVVESGRFVLLGGVAKNAAESFQEAFKAQFETTAGDVNTFFDRGDEEHGDGGLILG